MYTLFIDWPIWTYPLNLTTLREKSLTISMQLLVHVYSFVSLWDGRERRELNSMSFPLFSKLRVLRPKFSYFQMTLYFKYLWYIHRKFLYYRKLKKKILLARIDAMSIK